MRPLIPLIICATLTACSLPQPVPRDPPHQWVDLNGEPVAAGNGKLAVSLAKCRIEANRLIPYEWTQPRWDAMQRTFHDCMYLEGWVDRIKSEYYPNA